MRVNLNPNPIDPVEAYGTVTVEAGATQELCSIRIRTGCRARLYAIGNGVQAGGESSVRFQLLQGDAPVIPYDGSVNQWGDPSSPPVVRGEIYFAQGSLVKIVAVNSGGSSYDATGRIMVDYEPL